MFSKYEYVYAVYKAGNFTKAAQSLFISQPSLSVAIRNIEKQVGAPLFDRTGSGAELTEIGREYIAAAERIRNIERDFSNRIHDIYNLETGTLSVGGTNYLCSYVLPRIVTRFKALYPKIEVTLTEANSATLGEMIDNEQLDIVIDSFDANMDLYEGEPLTKEQLLLCLPSARELTGYQGIYPRDIYNGTADLAKMPAVPIALFKDEPFILLKPGNDMYHRAQKLFEKGSISPNVLFSVDQLNISCALVESGMGACFATDTFFKFAGFRSDVLLYNVSQEHSTRTLYIANKKNKHRTRAMEEFIRVAKEVFQK